MFTISEVEGRWVLTRDDEQLGDFATYAEAVDALASAGPEAPQATGVLGDTWTSEEGIAFAEATGDGRDFTGVVWSWRDPGVSLLPLMFQDRTDMGHFGAELAGYISSLSQAGGTVQAEGHFYDSETGRAARDLLLDGRRFGVSVDPGAVTASWECVTEDEDGWCTEERITFQAYEVIGLTMTPFPAFARAAIGLGGGAEGQLAVAPADHAFTDENGDGKCDACLAEDSDGNCTQVCDLTEEEHAAQAAPPQSEASALVAACAPLYPPRSWFEVPEPPFGDPSLVEQEDGTMAVPLTITDEGQVYGHAGRWGQCHISYLDHCVSPPSSPTGYRGYHLGVVRTAEGDDVTTGPLTVGTDHAPSYLGPQGARDHYAHTGLAWGDVRATDGVFGVWVCGTLRPSVTPELLRVLRASGMSGDWRNGDMIGVLTVNTPGFPIMREALVASGVTHMSEERPRARFENGKVVTLVAAGQVRRCPDCAARARAARAGTTVASTALDARALAMLGKTLRDAVESAVAPLRAQLDRVELRTRHLRGDQAEATRARLRPSTDPVIEARARRAKATAPA